MQDVTWRYTSIKDSSDTITNIPNSLMTSTAVCKLSPLNEISIPRWSPPAASASPPRPITLRTPPRRPSPAYKLKKRPSVSFSSITDYGFKGSLSFTIAEASKASSATDAAIRAVAPYVHNHLIEEAMGDLTGQKLTDAARVARARGRTRKTGHKNSPAPRQRMKPTSKGGCSHRVSRLSHQRMRISVPTASTSFPRHNTSVHRSIWREQGLISVYAKPGDRKVLTYAAT